MFVLILVLSLITEFPVDNANSENPDQTPRFAASDLELYCLPLSLLEDARHDWVNITVPV